MKHIDTNEVTLALSQLQSGDPSLVERAHHYFRHHEPVSLKVLLTSLFESGSIDEGIFLFVLLMSGEPSNVETALQKIDAGEEGFRFPFCQDLQSFPSASAIPYLYRWAEHDSDPSTRAEACWALTQYPSQTTVDVLTRIAARDFELDYEDETVSGVAKKALNKIQNTKNGISRS